MFTVNISVKARETKRAHLGLPVPLPSLVARVPSFTMETVPVTGLEELDKHLDELLADPTIDLNAKLFDHVELQLTGTVPRIYDHVLPEIAHRMN